MESKRDTYQTGKSVDLWGQEEGRAKGDWVWASTSLEAGSVCSRYSRPPYSKRRPRGRILTKRWYLQLWQIQSGRLSLGVSQGIKLWSLWHERVKSLTQGRSETVKGFTVNIFSPSGTPTWRVWSQLQHPPFCPAQPQTKLFLLNKAGARAWPFIPINSYFLRSWDQLTKALPSFRGLKCALGRGGRSDGARWEKTLGSLVALWSLSRLQHSRAESRPPSCDLKTSQSLQKNPKNPQLCAGQQ